MIENHENVDKNIEKMEKIQKNKPESKGLQLKLTLAMLFDQTLLQELVHYARTW